MSVAKSGDFGVWLQQQGGYSEREIRKRVGARHGFRDDPSCANWDEVEEFCQEMERDQRSIEIIDLQVDDRDVLYHVDVVQSFQEEEDEEQDPCAQTQEIERKVAYRCLSASEINVRRVRSSAIGNVHLDISRGNSDASMSSWAATSDGEQSPKSMSSSCPSWFQEDDNQDLPSPKALDARFTARNSSLSKGRPGLDASAGGGREAGVADNEASILSSRPTYGDAVISIQQPEARQARDRVLRHPAVAVEHSESHAEDSSTTLPLGHFGFRRCSARLARRLFSKIHEAKRNVDRQPGTGLEVESESSAESLFDLADLMENCYPNAEQGPISLPRFEEPCQLRLMDQHGCFLQPRRARDEKIQSRSSSRPTEMSSPAGSAGRELKFRSSQRVYDEMDLVTLSPDLPSRVQISSDEVLGDLCEFTDSIGVRISGIDLTAWHEEDDKALICLNLEAGI